LNLCSQDVSGQPENSTSITSQHAYVEPSYFPLFLLASFIIIAGLTLIVIGIIRKFRKSLDDKLKIGFLDLIRDGDHYPSLPRFQFLIWTFVISFVYLSIYLIRIYLGRLEAPFIDNNLLILLGISIVSPILGNIISGYKYTRRLSKTDSEKTDIENNEQYSFITMLFENSKPALFRYQMFLWTFVGVFIFLSIFASGLYTFTQDYIDGKETQIKPISNPGTTPCTKIDSIKMPTIDPMLVTLMGLSQSGYLGGKIVARSPARITKLIPGLQNKFLIMGLNFGEKNGGITSGTILIDDRAVAGHADTDVKWFDTKIEFQLPEEYKNKSFKLGLIIDDVVFLEEEYKAVF
jgi:hypothetical protein